jgi:Ca2+-transporting ATPase
LFIHLNNYKGNIPELDKYIQSRVPENLRYFTSAMAVCNQAQLLLSDKGDRVVRSGLPTEAALKVLNEKIGRLDTEFKKK